MLGARPGSLVRTVSILHQRTITSALSIHFFPGLTEALAVFLQKARMHPAGSRAALTILQVNIIPSSFGANAGVCLEGGTPCKHMLNSGPIYHTSLLYSQVSDAISEVSGQCPWFHILFLMESCTFPVGQCAPLGITAFLWVEPIFSGYCIFHPSQVPAPPPSNFASRSCSLSGSQNGVRQ